MTPEARTAFRAFLEARSRIWVQRDVLGARRPWTTDPILANFRFCNVFRELDTVTKWIRTYIREPGKAYPYLWFQLCIARMINWPATLAECFLAPTLLVHGQPQGPAWPKKETWDPHALVRVLTQRKLRKEKVYTGAYMIRADNVPATRDGASKALYLAHRVLAPLWVKRHELTAAIRAPEPSVERTTRLLQAFYGWGGFMAYEVATDLAHVAGWLQAAPDRYTWANPGPGAQRGLNRLLGRPLKAAWREAEAVAYMRTLLDDLNHDDLRAWRADPAIFSAVFPGDDGRFEMRDVEHTLCEFDKYERTRLGEGRPRARYP